MRAFMTSSMLTVGAAGLLGMAVLAQAPNASRAAELQKWGVHDATRPMPPEVDPGPAGAPAPVPSDAIVLFNGKDMSGWTTSKGAPAKWVVNDGIMQAVKGAGSIQTERAFGDCQLHIEWATPAKVKGESQARGNSGVFLMGIYEVQVLDSYENRTYADGQAAALYGQEPPLVNASRPPGEWQSYDIVFRAPRFDAAGAVVSPARMTVVHNGILVHDAQELTGPTAHKARPPYKAHADRLPVGLQDHSHPVRFRNIWIREL